MTAKHSGVAKLWLLNLFGNAALLAAVYYWLLMPDAHGWQVAVSGAIAIVVVFFGLVAAHWDVRLLQGCRISRQCDGVARLPPCVAAHDCAGGVGDFHGGDGVAR